MTHRPLIDRLVFVGNNIDQEDPLSHYTYLTLEERESILHFRDRGYSISAVVQMPGSNKSTVSRKLRRNKPRNHYRSRYSPVKAQWAYKKCHMKCRLHKRLESQDLYQTIAVLFYFRDNAF
ncbi:helix-turn-helix domain-containing protein [Pyramidobacter piscolens]|uniref:helix-turn-helix domain-containing protein n=1 Tax=Pyramidobacter piscolens TaxID=638849 RepID=UPI0034615E96